MAGAKTTVGHAAADGGRQRPVRGPVPAKPVANAGDVPTAAGANDALARLDGVGGSLQYGRGVTD